MSQRKVYAIWQWVQRGQGDHSYVGLALLFSLSKLLPSVPLSLLSWSFQSVVQYWEVHFRGEAWRNRNSLVPEAFFGDPKLGNPLLFSWIPGQCTRFFLTNDQRHSDG